MASSIVGEREGADVNKFLAEYLRLIYDSLNKQFCFPVNR